ncbi:MAG TPA: DUF4358 domain-containing protein [Clostridiales bacterium]|nr:DUF4358 domain-containing protein [Clostridiales bacterium]
MKKNIMLVLILVAILSLTACKSKKVKDNDQTNSHVDTEATPKPEEEPEEELDEENNNQEKLNAIKKLVVEAYGENYIAGAMEMDDSMLKELYGIDSSWYDAKIAEMPMMSVHVDTFIALHPTEGNGDKIKTALEAYKEMLVNDSMQYPMNIAKVNAATIVEEDGNYYFIMLGNNDVEEENEEKRLEIFKEENEKAIKVIKEFAK